MESFFTSTHSGFNPRTRKGCDFHRHTDMIGINVSIHAPVKDATNRLKDVSVSMAVSIHAPVKDATFVHLMLCSVGLFQSTHP